MLLPYFDWVRRVITRFKIVIRAGISYCSLDGNTMLEREKPKEYSLLIEQRIWKKPTKLMLSFLLSSYLLVLGELIVPQSMLLFQKTKCMKAEV